jgi:hypothetical protein
VASNGNSLRTSSPTGITSFVIPAGYYVHVVNNANSSSGTWDLSFLGTTKLIVFPDDATRFLGGSVYVKLNQITGGTLSSSKVISEAYSVGLNNTNVSPTAGGIMSIIGEGYTISNPAVGIFDIKFNLPFTQIYGISTNILDAYGSSGNLTTGQNPDPTRAGSLLLTTDNTQVSFISNSILRVKTGNGTGGLATRPFTFLVTGK